MNSCVSLGAEKRGLAWNLFPLLDTCTFSLPTHCLLREVEWQSTSHCVDTVQSGELESL